MPEHGDQAERSRQPDQGQRKLVGLLEPRGKGQDEDGQRNAKRRHPDDPDQPKLLGRDEQVIERTIDEIDENADNDGRPPLQTQAWHKLPEEGVLGFRVMETQGQRMHSGHR